MNRFKHLTEPLLALMLLLSFIALGASIARHAFAEEPGGRVSVVTDGDSAGSFAIVADIDHGPILLAQNTVTTSVPVVVATPAPAATPVVASPAPTSFLGKVFAFFTGPGGACALAALVAIDQLLAMAFPGLKANCVFELFTVGLQKAEAKNPMPAPTSSS